VVWCGVVWCGVVWCGVVWCGAVWCVYVYYRSQDFGSFFTETTGDMADSFKDELAKANQP
jgi:hypothetical protein